MAFGETVSIVVVSIIYPLTTSRKYSSFTVHSVETDYLYWPHIYKECISQSCKNIPVTNPEMKLDVN